MKRTSTKQYKIRNKQVQNQRQTSTKSKLVHNESNPNLQLQKCKYKIMNQVKGTLS